jgi:hypothetical protein
MVAFEDAAKGLRGSHLTIAGDPDQPIQHIVHQIDWASLSDEEIEDRDGDPPRRRSAPPS